MPNQEPPAEATGTSISSSHGVQIGSGHGVQIGSGNVQHNWTIKPPLDRAALLALSPHTAVARLQKLPHDELVDFFAGVDPDDASEIIDIMFRADVEKVTTVLADVNRREATKLIERSCLDPKLFGLLPEASEAIWRKAAAWGWTEAGSVLVWAQGYSRTYSEGNICWSSNGGTRAISGTILTYYTSTISGRTFRELLGFPTGDAERAPTSGSGIEGLRQSFQNATVYSSVRGAFSVPHGGCYETEKSSGGWLGFPVGEMQKNGHLGLVQEFEGGFIYYYADDTGKKSFPVVREIAAVLPISRKSRPISAEDIVNRPTGEGRTVQHFEMEGESGTAEIAVYWDERNEPIMVPVQIWEYYSGLGREQSWLGFPVEAKSHLFDRRGGRQDFEAGRIYWQPYIDPIAVPAEVVKLLKSRIHGYPVFEEQPFGEDSSGRIQFFENAVVTLQNGKREVWIRADAVAVEPNTAAATKGTWPVTGYRRPDRTGED